MQGSKLSQIFSVCTLGVRWGGTLIPRFQTLPNISCGLGCTVGVEAGRNFNSKAPNSRNISCLWGCKLGAQVGRNFNFKAPNSSKHFPFVGLHTWSPSYLSSSLCGSHKFLSPWVCVGAAVTTESKIFLLVSPSLLLAGCFSKHRTCHLLMSVLAPFSR